MSLEEKTSYFVWIDLQGKVHIADNCNDVKNEIGEIRKNYLEEINKFIDCQKNGLKRSNRKFDCLGAFVLMSNETVDFLTDGYFSSGLQYVYDFLDANKNALCIPVHMNLNKQMDSFENTTINVLSIFDGTYNVTTNIQGIQNVKEYAKDFVEFEFLAQGLDFVNEEELNDFLNESKGFVSVLVIAHCVMGGCTYDAPVLNAIIREGEINMFISEFNKLKTGLTS